MRLRSLCLVPLALTCACETAEPVDTLEPKLSVLQAKIFTPKCAKSGCHSGASPTRGLHLGEGKTFASTVGVAGVEASGGPWTRVVAGDPDKSLLVRVLEGKVGATARMPVGGELSAEHLAAVRAWVKAGAPND